LAGIVANLLQLNPNEKILVCTAQNYTADLLAEELFKLASLQQRVVRVYSQSKEDIFNVDVNTLKPYVLTYKMLFAD